MNLILFDESFYLDVLIRFLEATTKFSVFLTYFTYGLSPGYILPTYSHANWCRGFEFGYKIGIGGCHERIPQEYGDA